MVWPLPSSPHPGITVPTIPPFILRCPGVWSIPTSGPLHTPHLASQLLSLLIPFQLTRGFLKEAFSLPTGFALPLSLPGTQCQALCMAAPPSGSPEVHPLSPVTAPTASFPVCPSYSMCLFVHCPPLPVKHTLHKDEDHISPPHHWSPVTRRLCYTL